MKNCYLEKDFIFSNSNYSWVGKTGDAEHYLVPCFVATTRKLTILGISLATKKA